MKRLGTVARTAQGLVVVRATDGGLPDVGTDVVDEELETVGSVVDVFGPVDRPYVAVSPDDGPRATLVGRPVYARTDG